MVARGPVPAERLRRGLRAAQKLSDRMKTRHPSSLGPLRRMLDQMLPGEGEGYDGDRAELAPMGGGNHTLGRLMVLGALLDVRGEESLPVDSHPLIIIEEPEVHLHPILLASMWDVIEGLGAQTLVTTNSGEQLSAVPMRHLRRLARRRGRIDVHRLRLESLSPDELRRVGYHVRARRGGLLFARCWLLVEGESEFWLMRELARILGYDLDAEGVRCMAFAQCGVRPLVKLANDLGIEWCLLADGDESGAHYAEDAREHLPASADGGRIVRLKRPDVERCLWYHGYEDVYRRAAGLPDRGSDADDGRKRRPGSVIAKAVRAHSKPSLAITVAEACAERGPPGVPPVLRDVIETAVGLARSAIDDGSGRFWWPVTADPQRLQTPTPST